MYLPGCEPNCSLVLVISYSIEPPPKKLPIREMNGEDLEILKRLLFLRRESSTTSTPLSCTGGYCRRTSHIWNGIYGMNESRGIQRESLVLFTKLGFPFIPIIGNTIWNITKSYLVHHIKYPD